MSAMTKQTDPNDREIMRLAASEKPRDWGKAFKLWLQTYHPAHYYGPDNPTIRHARLGYEFFGWLDDAKIRRQRKEIETLSP